MSTLKVTRYSLPVGQLYNQHTWPLKVVTESLATGFPSEVFVYNASDGDDQYVGDIFEAVASVHQLYELGTSPAATSSEVKTTQYRRGVLEFHCRSEAEALDLWKKIVFDLHDLVNNFRAAEELKEEETITI